MSVEDALFTSVIDVVQLAVKALAQAIGRNPPERKKIEMVIGWFLVGLFVAGLIWLTVKYS